jgi:hypothetical protein
MKIRLFLIALTAFAFQLTSGLAAVDASKISTYEGKYRGTVLLGASGSSLFGTATGRFRASPVKERGTLVLTSQVMAGSTAIVFTEQFRFNKRSLVYTFSQSGSGFSAAGSGVGNASISKRSIRFSATFNISGSTFTTVGTIRRTKRGLSAVDTINVGGPNITFAYSLRGRK